MRYFTDLDELNRTVLAHPPDNVHRGFYREQVRHIFNMRHLGWEPAAPGLQHPLGSILPRYAPGHEPAGWADEVAEHMATHDWVERFGLSYKDVMALTVDEYHRLRALVRPRSTGNL